MQMVMCDKCGKPIDYRHRFQIENKTAFHTVCDDPYGVNNNFVNKAKTLPDFTWELKDRSKTV